jgi:hypothetical protein
MDLKTDKGSLDSDDFYKVVIRKKHNRKLEINLWFIASIVMVGGVVLDFLFGRDVGFILSERYSQVIFALMVLLFPVLFDLIFGAYPIEHLRRARELTFAVDDSERSKYDPKKRKTDVPTISDSISGGEFSNFSALELFAYYAASSRRLSQSLYSRSGVYLLVGVFVAFTGLVFFYMETSSSSGYQGIELVIAFAPKFGILLFIELVAFFFLRQHRSSMDEFRYYEAVKRKREETMALIQLTFESGKGSEVLELVKNGSFFSEGKLLNKDQTTEIIESRKLEKNELEILEKVLDVVSRSKK